jgi:hypothetical protein
MNKIAIASSILAALYSPVNSLLLTGNQTNIGSGPILSEAFGLRYHGTDSQYDWARRINAGLHSFWVYPLRSTIVNSKWDT